MKNFIRIYDSLRNACLTAARTLLFNTFNPNKTYAKVLVVRKGTIGDHAVCQPIYLAIKKYFESTQIHLLTSNGGNAYAHISKLPESSLFEQTYNFEDFGRKEMIAILKNNNYDLVIELPQDLDSLYTQIRNMLVYRYCGIKTGLGWSAGISFLGKKYRYFHCELSKEFEKHKNNLAEQGLSFNIPETYLSPVKTDLKTVITPNIDLKNAIVIAPGAKIKSKQWPTQNFQLLIERLVEKGHTILIIGTEEEGEPFIDLKVTNLCGKLTIYETRFLLSQCKLLICNDSGPMHLGYSVGIKLIALFGGRSYPKPWWPPSNSNNIVLHKNADYPVAYIGDKVLDKQSDGHLESIGIEEVLEAVDKLIK